MKISREPPPGGDPGGIESGQHAKRIARQLYTNGRKGPVAKGRRYPPFGKQLAEHTRAPFIVRVLAYGPPNYPHQTMPDAWAKAKQINLRSDSAALVLPAGEQPHSFTWPVRGMICVIEHWPSKGMDRIVTDLACRLFEHGAARVIVRDIHFNCTRRVFR